MKRLFRIFVLLALAVALPTQAAALPALAALCEDGAGAMHQSGHAHHGHGDHGTPHHGDDDSSAPAGTHGCCHHLFSAALPALPALSDRAPTGVVPTTLFHSDFFIPEQPQPPPLARLV